MQGISVLQPFSAEQCPCRIHATINTVPTGSTGALLTSIDVNRWQADPAYTFI